MDKIKALNTKVMAKDFGRVGLGTLAIAAGAFLWGKFLYGRGVRGCQRWGRCNRRLLFFFFPPRLFLRKRGCALRIAVERRQTPMNEQEFHPGSVPVAVVARVYGKDASWVRAGIISGWLPIGKATRNGNLVASIEEMDSRYGRINFYISPKRLYEETGYFWRGERR